MKYSQKRVGLAPFILGLMLLSGRLEIANAQTPPSDLTELSLEQILSLHVVKRPPLENAESAVASRKLEGWSIGYRYIHANFSGHRDGTDSLTNEELLVAPPPTHDKEFPILPTNIRQEAHVLEFGYLASEKLSFAILVPYIFQSTEHVSSFGGFSDFTIDSQGLGDVSVTPSYQVWQRGVHSVSLNGGISLPFGTINETGDTPFMGAGTVDPLPYTMQIGSGTLDLLPGMSYKGSYERWRWSAQALATLRLGRNYRGYSLGNRYALATRISYEIRPWLEPTFGVRAQTWERVHGSDPNLPSLPGPLYPATVADPRKYGGDKVNVSMGARFNILSGWFAGSTMETQASLPVYQRLNGPQPEEQWQLNLAWKWHF